MEIWDVYDKDRNKTGKKMERGSVFADGAYHMVVHVCIFNTHGEMLIQQRQPFKEGWPNMWDITVGGSATFGESSQSAAERELFEEIGYNFDLTNIRPHLTVNFEFGFDDYYLIETDITIENLKLQYEEVQQVKWASKEEVFQMLENGEFIPYYKNLLALLFEMRKRYSAHFR
ncbi:MAG: NUDIX domain-containing protein [Oscillospiraceae bacterium]|nr:NUDIX domain-containing protein [Oscillospiraceae bacterium]